MKRFKLTIAYDGTAYCGWQRQVDPTPTVQREIEKAAGFIVSHPVTVLGSSRKTPHPLPHPAPLAEIEFPISNPGLTVV